MPLTLAGACDDEGVDMPTAPRPVGVAARPEGYEYIIWVGASFPSIVRITLAANTG